MTSMPAGEGQDALGSEADRYQFRVVHADDAGRLAELLEAIDRTFLATEAFRPEAAHEIAHRQGRDVYALLLEDGRAVAYGLLRGWDAGFEVPSLGIAVRSAAQGRGVARRMMGELHREAASRGARSTRLRVHPANVAARRLYESLGYRYRGEERGELLMTCDLVSGPPST